MLKFLDESVVTDKNESKLETSAATTAQRKAEQARVKKNIRDWKRKTRKPPQQYVNREEIDQQIESVDMPVEEEKDIVEEEFLPVCTDPILGSLPPPPPPRDLHGITFAQTASLYDSVFLLAEGSYITVDEEAKIYQLIANSSPEIFDLFRSYEHEQDLGKFASNLVALSSKNP
jgi:hypothetical protein